MLVLCFVVHQPHSVSVCLFLVRGGRCRSRTAESDSAHRRPQGATPQRLLTHQDCPPVCRDSWSRASCSHLGRFFIWDLIGRTADVCQVSACVPERGVALRKLPVHTRWLEPLLASCLSTGAGFEQEFVCNRGTLGVYAARPRARLPVHSLSTALPIAHTLLPDVHNRQSK